MTDRTTAGLDRLHEQGWRSGLPPLMRAGFAAWWKTNDWWIQALLWTVVINGSVAAVIWGDSPDEIDAFLIYGVMTMFAAIAVAILMQEAIVGEKRSGTAAWILSKPASREAFILAKLVPNAIGVVVTMITIPSLILYIQFAVADLEVPIGLFTAGACVASLNLMFYLTLTLMLGTLFDSAGAVIAVPLAFAFGQQLLGSIPGLLSYLPWALVAPTGDPEVSVVASVIEGAGLHAPGAVAATAVACCVFTGVAFWKWNRTEL